MPSRDSGNNLNIQFKTLGIGQAGKGVALVDRIGQALIANTETILSSSAQTANATYPVDLSPYRMGIIVCDVTAWVGGTSPTIQFVVEAFDTTSGKWVPIATPASGAASAVETLAIFMDESTATVPTVTGFRYYNGHSIKGDAFGSNYRIRTVITGAPTSVTFSISFIGKPI